MPDYQNGKIYKIYCNITEEVYYGSTTVPLCKRMSGHRSNYAICLEGGKRSTCKSFAILGRGDYSYSLVEDCPCNSKEQLFARERFYIQNNYCVNKCVPGRTVKEWYEDNKAILLEKAKKRYEGNKEVMLQKAKKHYEGNKEVMLQKKKEYREDNKEMIAEKKKEYRERGGKEKEKEYYKKNKERIAERYKEKVRCECCDYEVTRGSWSQHTKSKKHQNNSK